MAIIVLVIVVAFSFVNNQNQSGLFPLAHPGEETIKVGAILPLTGKYSYIGQYMREGLELAKDEINKNGINGKKIELVYEDSQADTKQGISAYQKLVKSEDVKILITTLSGVTLAIAPLAEQDKVLVFAVGTASPKISEAGDYIFRHNLMPQTEAKFLADLIHKTFGFKEIGVVYVNAESGVAYKDEFTKRFEEEGGKIKLLEAYEMGSTDYRTLLLKIKESGVEAIFAASYCQDLGFILKQSKEIGLDVQWFSLYDAEGPQLLEIAGEIAEGLLYSHFFNVEDATPIVKEFHENYKGRYEKEPDPRSALCYDSLMVLAKAIEKCPDASPTCVKNELYKIKDFPAVTGAITFNQDGDTEKEIMVKTVRNGQFVLYE